jgi:hypothetical protein
MKIGKDDKIEIVRLLELKTASMVDKHSAQEMVRRYIDNGAKYCLSCDPSIRAMFKRLRNWYEANKDNKK